MLYWRKNKEIDEHVDALQQSLEERKDRAGQRARASFAVSAKRIDWLRRHVQTVRKLCANKVAILVYTFQVIYQYANIVTGYEFDFHYPEPAKSAVEYLSLFGLNLLSVSPPECVNADSNFYTRVLIATLSPLGVIVVGICLFRAYNSWYNRRE